MGPGHWLAPGVGQASRSDTPAVRKLVQPPGADLATPIKITHTIPFDPVIPAPGIRSTDTHTLSKTHFQHIECSIICDGSRPETT